VVGMVERSVGAKLHVDLNGLRKETCEEFDEIFKRLNIKKKMSMQKADIIIKMRQDKLKCFEAMRYGVQIGKKKY
jgi:hypothetical protein